MVEPRRFGVELDDGHYGPASYAEVSAVTLTEAWVRASREHHPARDGQRVMVVFSRGRVPYEEASRLDHSPITGQGDPH